MFLPYRYFIPVLLANEAARPNEHGEVCLQVMTFNIREL